MLKKQYEITMDLFGMTAIVRSNFFAFYFNIVQEEIKNEIFFSVYRKTVKYKNNVNIQSKSFFKKLKEKKGLILIHRGKKQPTLIVDEKSDFGISVKEIESLKDKNIIKNNITNKNIINKVDKKIKDDTENVWIDLYNKVGKLEIKKKITTQMLKMRQSFFFIRTR